MTRALAALVLLTSACGASAVSVHARAAIASETVLSQAQQAIRSARSAEVTRVIEAAPDQETAREFRDAIDVRFDPVVDVYETVRSVHLAWIHIVLAAVDGRPFDVAAAVSLAHDLVIAYDEMRRIGERIGIPLPALGDVVNAVLAAQEGT